MRTLFLTLVVVFSAISASAQTSGVKQAFDEATRQARAGGRTNPTSARAFAPAADPTTSRPGCSSSLPPASSWTCSTR
jgi:hypothetical protein